MAWMVCALMIVIGWITIGTYAETLQYSYGTPSESVTKADTNGSFVRIRGIRNRSEKDFVLGGIIPVHFNDRDSGGAKCGPARGDSGIFTTEAILYALDCINNDPDILPNLTIGYDIRDTCFLESIALEEALDLVIIGTDKVTEICEYDVYPSRVNSTQRSIPTLGMVGAAASRVSIPVASLGRLFQVPQISQSSTSPLLSNRDLYTYFFRTISPDNIQARAIIALMVQFGWNHISVIYSSDTYGTPARNEIISLAEQNNICVDLDQGIESDFTDAEYEALAWSLNGTNAEVVIVFTLQLHAEQLLEKFTNITDHRKLTWLASEAWVQSLSIISRYSDTLVGLFGTRPRTQRVDGFHDYLSTLTINGNIRNPWFPEFFSVLAECSLSSTCNTSASILDVYDYQQVHTIPRAIEAVYSFAYALQDYLIDNCDHPVKWSRHNYSCEGQRRPLDGPTMLQYLNNVSFTSPLNHMVEFNNLGFVRNDSYELLNYQAEDNPDGSRSYELKLVGLWESGSLQDGSSDLGVIVFTDGGLQYRVNESGDIVRDPHVPQCGHCTIGQYLEPGFSSCCGFCSKCLGDQFSNETSATECSKCDDNTWGDNPTQGSSRCVDIEEAYLSYDHPWAVIIEILALLGLLAVCVVMVLWGVFWKTPVIKSSGREQMIILLVGITLSYILAFFYVSPPVLFVCVIQRVGLWFCFSLLFGALMIKIMRVAYIFLQGVKSVKPIRFQRPKYLLLFTSLVVLIQLCLILGSVLVQFPEVVRDLRLNQVNNVDVPKTIVSCNRDHISFTVISLLYEVALILVTTVFGVISFKYPKNFNEAKHVSLCTFALVAIWLAFIPSYFATATLQEFQNATIALAVIMNASAVLVCIFGPRLYIIIFNRSADNVGTSWLKGQPSNTSTTLSSLPSNERTVSGPDRPTGEEEVSTEMS